MIQIYAHFTRAAECTTSSAHILPPLSQNYSEKGKFCKTEIEILFDTKSWQIKIHLMIKPEEMTMLSMGGVCQQVPIGKVAAHLITMIPREASHKRDV